MSVPWQPPVAKPVDSDAAFVPASQSDVLANRPPEPPRRGRGRPPGSPNKTPIQRAQEEKAKAEARLAGIQGPSAEEVLAKAREKAAAIKADTEQMAHWISEELNDYLMQAIITAGIPATMLYRDGHVPKAIANNDKYTELGNALAIPPTLAQSAARLAAEAKATDSGSKLAVATGNGRAGLVVAGIGTLFGTVTYARRVNDVLKRFKQVAELAEAAQTAPQPVATPAEQMNEGMVG